LRRSRSIAVATAAPLTNVTNDIKMIVRRIGEGAGSSGDSASAGASVDLRRSPARRSRSFLRRSMIRWVFDSHIGSGVASAPTICIRNESRPMNTMLVCCVSTDSLTVHPSRSSHAHYRGIAVNTMCRFR